MIKKICKFCNKEFLAKKNRIKFCSTECFHKSRIKEKIYTEFCRYCGQPLGKKGWKNKFCSPICVCLYNNESRKQRENPKKCSRCGNLIENKKGYLCSSCSKKYKIEMEEKTNVIKAMTIREYIQKYSYKGANRYSTIRDFARRWNKHLKKKPCQNCGYSKHTEFCHIKEINKNLDMTIGEINDENNILILCKNCHWEFDHGYLTLDILQKSC